MSNLKKVFILENSIELEIPNDWHLKEKSEFLKEISFPFGEYPKLGLNLEYFDNPKIRNENDIFNFLSDGVKGKKKIEKISTENYIIIYEIKTKDENLILWKVLNFLKPRSFRLLRLSLSWPNNSSANKIIRGMLGDIERVIRSIRFIQAKTIYDQLASLKYRLDNYRIIEKKLWNMYLIYLPERWKIDENNENQSTIISIDNDDFQLFIESTVINWNKEIHDTEKTVMTLIKEMTKSVIINQQSFRKSENDFIFAFNANEKIKKNQIICNNIWYRFKVFKRNIKIISLVLSYNYNLNKQGKVYSEYLDKKIALSEIS